MDDQSFLLDALSKTIISCDDDDCVEAAQKALSGDVEPNLVIDAAVDAIQEVGKRFEEGRIFIPDLMLAGMGMEKVMSMAQQKMLERGETLNLKGTIVLGTVAGDMHTIGKNLVVTLLRSNGYQVHDLGVDVTAAQFLKSAQQVHADVVGLSALMSTTLVEQKNVVEHFKRKGERKNYRIIVGGGVCSQKWATEIGADGYAREANAAAALVARLLFQ